MTTEKRLARAAFLSTTCALAVACGGSTAAPAPDSADASVDAASDDAQSDGSPDAAPDVAAIDAGDGTPRRQPCTGDYGMALDTNFGRLDGTIVSVVDVGQAKMTCNGDDSHVHLQVLMNGGVYDVAINVDGMFYEEDLPMPAPAWVEGWHIAIINSYPTLGVHSTQFQMLGIPATAAKVEAELANANHISVYGTGYGATGLHDTHYEGSGADGMVVLDPQTPAASHVLFFDFAGDTF